MNPTIAEIIASACLAGEAMMCVTPPRQPPTKHRKFPVEKVNFLPLTLAKTSLKSIITEPRSRVLEAEVGAKLSSDMTDKIRRNFCTKILKNLLGQLITEGVELVNPCREADGEEFSNYVTRAESFSNLD